jgi:hypothetical protein
VTAFKELSYHLAIHIEGFKYSQLDSVSEWNEYKLKTISHKSVGA